MSEIRIESQETGQYLLVGELSFNTVAGISDDFDKIVRDNDDIVLDLQGVTRTDSAGLALLIDWMRAAHHQNKHLVFRNMPSQMLAVATVSDLDDILPLE